MYQIQSTLTDLYNNPDFEIKLKPCIKIGMLNIYFFFITNYNNNNEYRIKKLRKYFPTLNEKNLDQYNPYIIASILDPRFKLAHNKTYKWYNSNHLNIRKPIRDKFIL